MLWENVNKLASGECFEFPHISFTWQWFILCLNNEEKWHKILEVDAIIIVTISL